LTLKHNAPMFCEQFFPNLSGLYGLKEMSLPWKF
jgi:hypothetical protein